MDQALSPAEVQHFLTFGYVHRRGCFSATEMDALTAHADARLATSEVSNHDGRAQSGPAPAAVLESNNLDEVAFIGPVLADRRVHGAVKQLMEALGASRFLFGGDSHLSAGPIKSEGWTGFATLPADAGADTPHAGAALDKDWYEHGWHRCGQSCHPCSIGIPSRRHVRMRLHRCRLWLVTVISLGRPRRASLALRQCFTSQRPPRIRVQSVSSQAAVSLDCQLCNPCRRLAAI
jgi:hypothetical protein